MLGYYMLPSVILFFLDRFVPKVIQARSLYPEASCALNEDAKIIKLTLASSGPIKPCYPGDYILVQVPELGIHYHPFTIASYWPEDPGSIVLFIRVYSDKKWSWTGASARVCENANGRVRVKVNIGGVFGDRRHDYLKSKVLIFFVAGSAITTFMALIKAIAAQAVSSSQPPCVQVHLICTFRTRSELHAYGSFFHQIIRDPGFANWLHVEIYVSRADKIQIPPGAHADVEREEVMPLENYNITAVPSLYHDHSVPSLTQRQVYQSRCLPTFHGAQSASVSIRMAKLDFGTSIAMTIIPLALWLILRAIHWEGSALYCNVVEFIVDDIQ
ncbi:hypothetical protein BGX26_006052 [Mortierella sp. AD094]|nr:hypothetical protein BGX26_006052 [Mortierella sp. AD094]